MSVLQDLYDSDINFTISALWERVFNAVAKALEDTDQ